MDLNKRKAMIREREKERERKVKKMSTVCQSINVVLTLERHKAEQFSPQA